MNRKEAKEKAYRLVSKMTLDEKAGQLKYDAPAIPRLNIPAYNWWNEALHGVARAGTATSFPQAIGMAATFDEELLQEVGDVIAEEGRAKYNAYSGRGDRDIYKGLTFWSPNVNIFRDPRWGRGHETYGEDPFLSARLGVAYVKGLQGDKKTMKAAACAKHYAVHSGPESVRHEFNAIASAKDMEETYLPAFKALVKEAGVESVMGAYNRTNGEPCCGSKTLIQDKLRREWGFEGHFVSDCWAIKDFHENHGVTYTAMESAAMALNAGCDLNCGNTYLHVLNACKHGLVSEEAITESAIRLFTTRYLLGLFDGSEFDQIGYEKIECKEHIDLAHKTSLESIVMLKNDGVLPIDLNKVGTIGVIGPNANSRRALIGNYHGTSSEYVTLLEGIQHYVNNDVSDDVRVLYSQGCELTAKKTEHLALEYDRISEAVIVAEHSDVVILCLGLDETLEGEEGDTGNRDASGDKVNIELPSVQQRLMEAVSGTGKPVVLCMLAGSDLDLSFADKHFNGIIQLWYPGARGGNAAAEILFGKTSPSGKLPITFYKSLAGLPAYTDYSMAGRTYRYLKEPAQFPFGFGLTYSNVDVKQASITGGRFGAVVKAAVQNTGEYEAGDVIQVYIKCEDSKFAVPNPSLCGFTRVYLKPGDETEVAISLPESAFTIVNDDGKRISDGRKFTIYVGVSQPDPRSRELTGKNPICLSFEVLYENAV